MIVLSPSILTADFGNLQEEVEKAVRGGCDWLHLDIMDGHFVPNITIGPMIVKALRRYAAVPFDVHLMVENPDGLLKLYADAGADIVTVHQEALGCRHLHRTIQHIKELGLKAGCAVNPGTPVELLEPVLADLDMVLIMTVNPGFGGQSFIPSTLHKIARLRAMAEQWKPDLLIQVDGGINAATCGSVIQAGANVLVVGSAIFDGVDPEGNVRKYKALLERRED